MTSNNEHQRTGVFRITPVSPLHIGSGQVLTPMDYEIRNGKFIVKDILRFIDAQRDDPAYALQVIQDRKPIGEEFNRYALPCYNEATPPTAPRAQQQPLPPRRQPQMGKPGKMDPQMAAMMKKTKSLREQQSAPAASAVAAPVRESRQEQPGGEVREFIKDPFGKAFIPGSSLKGCLRTALAYTLVKSDAMNMKLVDDLLNNDRVRRERAFEGMDKNLFRGINEKGKQDVTTDVLKALVVRDSAPFDFNLRGVMCFIRVMNDYLGRWDVKKNMPIRVEALSPESDPIDMPFILQTGLIAADPALQKAAQGKIAALLVQQGAFVQALRDFSSKLLEHETEFYHAYGQDAAPALQFVQVLAKDQRENKSIYLDLGFSTGWHTKTIGMAFDEQDINDIRDRFGLGKRNVDLFPKTRKWAKTPDGYLPLGWIKLEVIQNEE